MKYFQRLVMDWDETRLSIGSEGGTHIFSESQEKMFSLFSAGQRMHLFRRKKKIAFTDLYRDGSIQDVALFSAYIRFVLLNSGVFSSFVGKIDLAVILPTFIHQTEKKLWLDACELAGVSGVTFCGQGIAGVVGSGFPFPLPTFALIISLGWSFSECTGIVFDQSSFCLPLQLTGYRLLSSARAKVYDAYGVEASPQFWSAVIQSLSIFVSPELANGQDAYSRLLLAERKKIPFEFLVETIRDHLNRTALAIQMKISDLSSADLSVAMTQGVLLGGEIGNGSHLEKYFSNALSLPVYTTPDVTNASVLGATQIMAAMQMNK